MQKIKSPKAWLKCGRLWEKFLAYCDGGFDGFRRVVREIATFRQAGKPPKKREFRPAIFTFEERSAPTSLLTGPASVLGASACASDRVYDDALRTQTSATSDSDVIFADSQPSSPGAAMASPSLIVCLLEVVVIRTAANRRHVLLWRFPS